MGRGGGAFTLHNSMNLMDLLHFGEKDTFSRLQEGRSWEADGGVFKWGGRFSAYMVGRRRGAGYTYEAFFT